LQPASGVEHSFVDPLNDEVCYTVRIIDGRVSGCQLGAAAKTGPEARLLGSLRAVEESAVGCLRRPGRAHRATVDPGRCHTHVEHAVEAGVVRGKCLVESSCVSDHVPESTSRMRVRSPFSAMAAVTWIAPRIADSSP